MVEHCGWAGGRLAGIRGKGITTDEEMMNGTVLTFKRLSEWA